MTPVVVALLLLASPSLVAASASARAHTVHLGNVGSIDLGSNLAQQKFAQLVFLEGLTAAARNWDGPLNSPTAPGVIATNNQLFYRDFGRTLDGKIVRLSAGGPLVQTAGGPVVAVGGTAVKAADGTVRVLGGTVVKTVGSALVQSLGTAVLQTLVLAAVGWVLDQYGLNNGLDSQIAEIRSQLNEIQGSLNRLEAATTQLRTELADSTYANLVNQAVPIVAHVNTGMKDLDFIAHMSADDPTKPKLTEETLNFIHEHLLFGKQRELADRISGTAGASGLIHAAYKVAETHHRLWTQHTSREVLAVVAYYQAAEQRLLSLRVEYWHAHPETYSPEYIESQINDVEGMLQNQDSELKPEPIHGVVADTRTDLEWFWPGMVGYYLPYNKVKYVAQIWGTGNGNYFCCPSFGDIGYGWHLPHIGEIVKFIEGWSDPSGTWIGWLNREIGGQLESYTWQGRNYPLSEYAPNGVWAGNEVTPPYTGVSFVQGINRDGRPSALSQSDDTSLRRSPFVVRTRTSNYW